MPARCAPASRCNRHPPAAPGPAGAAGRAAGRLGATGCDRGEPPNAKVEFPASFEARCAALPASEPEIVARPIEIVEDDSRPEAELARLFARGGTAPAQRTLGLTVTRIGHEASIEIKGLSDPAHGRACFRPRIRVELSMRPLTVHVAREIAGDPCRRAAIREHEQKHVAVYEAFLHEETARLARAFPAEFATAVRHVPDLEAGLAELHARLADHLREALAVSEAMLAARQRDVDSPAEYARIGAACADRR